MQRLTLINVLRREPVLIAGSLCWKFISEIYKRVHFRISTLVLDMKQKGTYSGVISVSEGKAISFPCKVGFISSRLLRDLFKIVMEKEVRTSFPRPLDLEERENFKTFRRAIQWNLLFNIQTMVEHHGHYYRLCKQRAESIPRHSSYLSLRVIFTFGPRKSGIINASTDKPIALFSANKI